MQNSDIFWGKNCVKFGNFVNFSYIFFGQKCRDPLKLTELLRLLNGSLVYRTRDVNASSLTNLGPAEHMTDWHGLAKNAFAMFVQVFHDELLDMHLHRHTETRVPVGQQSGHVTEAPVGQDAVLF